MLVEGVTDYLVALEWRVPAITAMGTHASPEVRAEVRDATRAAEVVPLVLDDDKAGSEAGAAWLEWLGPKAAPVRWPHGVTDVGDLGPRPDGPAVFHRMLADAERRWRAERLPRAS